MAEAAMEAFPAIAGRVCVRPGDEGYIQLTAGDELQVLHQQIDGLYVLRNSDKAHGWCNRSEVRFVPQWMLTMSIHGNSGQLMVQLVLEHWSFYDWPGEETFTDISTCSRPHVSFTRRDGSNEWTWGKLEVLAREFKLQW